MNIKKKQVNNIITKSNLPVSEYAANPYVGCSHACKYCYASFMKRFTNHCEQWGEFLDVKYWNTIKNVHKYDEKKLFLGSVTDPYNPQEDIYFRTHELLEQLKESKIKLTIQTKSDLILRDLKLIKSFSGVRVGFSINTLDEKFKNDMDDAVSISRRIIAMKKFYEARVCTVCFISPIFPGITNVLSIIEQVKNVCNLVWLENLNLRGNYKATIMDYIKKISKFISTLSRNLY